MNLTTNAMLERGAEIQLVLICVVVIMDILATDSTAQVNKIFHDSLCKVANYVCRGSNGRSIPVHLFRPSPPPICHFAYSTTMATRQKLF